MTSLIGIYPTTMVELENCFGKVRYKISKWLKAIKRDTQSYSIKYSLTSCELWGNYQPSACGDLWDRVVVSRYCPIRSQITNVSKNFIVICQGEWVEGKKKRKEEKKGKWRGKKIKERKNEIKERLICIQIKVPYML